MIEITHARTGRSMKKRMRTRPASFQESGVTVSGLGTGVRVTLATAPVPLGLMTSGAGMGTGFGLDGGARADLLQAVDDHPFASLETVLDRSQAVCICPSRIGRRATSFLVVDDRRGIFCPGRYPRGTVNL